MKAYAIGDIHGAYKALIQCFERSKFDYKKDRLIVMGDVCGGYPDVKKCIDELLKVKHCDLAIGNHDMWALDWALRLYNTLQPIHVCNVWNLDTGAGWSGKLTIMNVTTKEYWQSDLTPDLYGGTPDKL